MNRLGSSQHYQFMSYGINDPDYFWGSNLKEGSSTEVLGSTGFDGDGYPSNKTYSGYHQAVRQSSNGMWIEANLNAWIPRSTKTSASGYRYSDSGIDVEWNANHAGSYWGVLYNTPAAVAETDLVGRTYTGSICSAGWTIPDLYDNLFETYFNTTSYTNRGRVTALPLSLAGSNLDFGFPSNNFTETSLYSQYFTRTRYFTNAQYGIDFSSSDIYNNARIFIGSPGQIRCVNKGSVREPVVATCSPNSICYNANGGSGTIADQIVTPDETDVSATTAALASASALSKDGYYFAGWSTSSTGYGDIYDPGETITVGDLSSTGKQLYAHWGRLATSMQSFSKSQCKSMASGETITLPDVRDGKNYEIIRLNDGNCWMTGFLSFAESELDPLTSNVSSSKTIEWNLTDKNYIAHNYSTPYVNTNWTAGYKYTYPGASAMLVASTYSRTEATESICPSGWKLPSITDIEETDDVNLSKFVASQRGGSGQNYSRVWTSTNYPGDSESGYTFNIAGDGASRYVYDVTNNSSTFIIRTTGKDAANEVRCIFNQD